MRYIQVTEKAKTARTLSLLEYIFKLEVKTYFVCNTEYKVLDIIPKWSPDKYL